MPLPGPNGLSQPSKGRGDRRRIWSKKDPPVNGRDVHRIVRRLFPAFLTEFIGRFLDAYYTETEVDAALDLKAELSHTHDAADIVSGTLNGDRLPAMSAGAKGGVPATGAPSGKYLRDDGTWQVIPAGNDGLGPDGDVGDATVGGGGTTLTIDANAVTYAKMQDVSATSRILGRKTAGAGDPEECTLSEVLDFIGSAAQGDILYRGAASWARLGAGTAGHALLTGGAGANPSWGAVGDMLLGTAQTVSAAKTFLDQMLKVRNPGNTQSYVFAAGAITADRTLNLPLTRQTETLAVQPTVTSGTNSDPTGTSNTTGVMMGLNKTLTPVVTGRVLVIVSGQVTNGTGDNGSMIGIRYGTGAAPANGDALAGTLAGDTQQASDVASGTTTATLTSPFCHHAFIEGLTLGTAYWFDISLAAVTGGTATASNINITIIEI